MVSCERCQGQLLPYLYDVLDAGEQAELQSHLGDCNDCRTALEAARQQRTLLAAAVKEEFPDVRFVTPAPAPPPRRRSLRSLLWRQRWATAAAIFLMILGGAITLLGLELHKVNVQVAAATERVAAAQQAWQQAQSAAAGRQQAARSQVRTLEQQIDKLIGDWKRREQETRPVAAAHDVQLLVTGPQNFSAGERNELRVEVKPGPSADASALSKLGMLSVRAIDQRRQKVLYEQKFDAGQKQVDFELPRNLPVTPEADVVLEVEAGGGTVATREQLPLSATEYVTHLATDRPLYRPGDTVRFRSLTLERFGLLPAAEDLQLRYRLVDTSRHEVFRHDVQGSPRQEDGRPLAGPDGQPLRGVGCGELKLPPQLPEGRYVLSVSEANGRFVEEKRPLRVQQRAGGAFGVALNFDRASYAPGERVQVELRAESLSENATGTQQAAAPMPGMPGAGATTAGIQYQYHVLGTAQPQNGGGAVGGDGRAVFFFTMPSSAGSGAAALNVELRDAVSAETFTRAVPTTAGDLTIDFYPEGGDLVAGSSNRVYFEARTAAGRPATIAGRVGVSKTEAGVPVAMSDPDTGRGSFAFVPRPGTRYELFLDSPLGGRRRFPLPAVKPGGVVLHVPTAVFADELKLDVTSADRDRELLAAAFCRGRLVAHADVRALAGQKATVQLHPSGGRGVCRLTIYEKSSARGGLYQPVAERLVYCRPQQKVVVSARPDKEVYLPGAPVRLQLEARDERNELVPALALVAVTSGGVHRGGVPRRDFADHFYIATELRRPQDLEDADLWLAEGPGAAAALDRLLATHGWRRFAEPAGGGAADRRALAAQPVTRLAGVAPTEVARLDRDLAPQFIGLQKQLAESELDAQTPADARPDVQQLQTNLAQSDQTRIQLQAVADELRAFILHFVLLAGVSVTSCASLMLLALGLRRLSAGRPGRTWIITGLGLGLVLFVGAMCGTVQQLGRHQQLSQHSTATSWPVTPAPSVPPAPARSIVDVPDAPAEDSVFVAGDALNETQPAPEAGRRIYAANMPAGSPSLPAPLDDATRPEATPAPEGASVADEGARFGAIAGRLDALAAIPAPVGTDQLGAEWDRYFRQRGDYQVLLRRKLGRPVSLPALDAAPVAREYAHRRAADAADSRPQTVYWHPALVLAGGKAEIAFELGAAVQAHQVVILGHTLDGRLGSDLVTLGVQAPLGLVAGGPEEATAGDVVALPLSLTNNTATPAKIQLELQGRGLRLQGADERFLTLDGAEQRRELVQVQPAAAGPQTALRVRGRADAGRSVVTERLLRVVPDGYPAMHVQAGTVSPGLPVTVMVDIPEDRQPGSARVELRVYPSALAELSDALDACRSGAGGGFELDAARQYLGVLALEQLQSRHRALPGLEALARRVVEEKQAEFRAAVVVQDDDALLALALQLLHERARVLREDAALLKELRAKLLARRGQANSAYFIWALAATGAEPLDAELALLRQRVEAARDPGLVALAALSHLQRKRLEDAVPMLAQLAAQQKDDGSLRAAPDLAVGRTERDRRVATVALALLAWQQSGRGEFAPNLHKGLVWLRSQRDEHGGFGNPHATVLALKAILGQGPQERPSGEQRLIFQRLEPGTSFTLQTAVPPRSDQPLVLKPDAPDGWLSPGRHQLDIRLQAEQGQLPFSLTWSYRTPRPAAATVALNLTAQLSKQQAREAEQVRLTAVVENRADEAQGPVVAVLSLPAGLVLPDTAARPDGVDSWQVQGRAVTLAWPRVAAGARVEVHLDLECRYPGRYRGLPNEAHLFHAPAAKAWAPPLGIVIEAR